jgi:hypothetical protein
MKIGVLPYVYYSITIPSLVRASLVCSPSVVHGFERQNLSSYPLKLLQNNTIFLLNFALNHPHSHNGSNSYNRLQTA